MVWRRLCDTVCEIVPKLENNVLVDKCFRVSFPTTFRPKPVYSPVLAGAWQALLGDNWYEQVHPPHDFTVPKVLMNKWKSSSLCRARVAANIKSWLSFGLPRNVLLWYRLLQAAYDFSLPHVFDICLQAHPWSSDELALFYLIW